MDEIFFLPKDLKGRSKVLAGRPESLSELSESFEAVPECFTVVPELSSEVPGSFTGASGHYKEQLRCAAENAGDMPGRPGGSAEVASPTVVARQGMAGAVKYP